MLLARHLHSPYTHLDIASIPRAQRGACLGVDVGGTFTDFLLWEHGRLAVHKRPSAPEDLSQAVPADLDEITGRGGPPDRGR